MSLWRCFSPFLQVVLVDGIPLSSCWVYIFVAFLYMTFQPVNGLLLWIVSTEWKQFYAIYALCFTGVCFGFIKIVPNRINYIIQFVTSTNSRNHTQSPRPILHDDSVFWSDPAMRDAIRVRHLLILRNRGRLVNGINFVCHSDHSAGCQWSQFDQLIAEIN